MIERDAELRDAVWRPCEANERLPVASAQAAGKLNVRFDFPEESMVRPNDDFLSSPELDYDGFTAALRENFGCFSPARGTSIFAGRVRPRRVFGFAAVDVACNTVRVDRTELDVRRDEMEYYFVVAQLTGRSTIIQNDRVVNAAAGELVLLDSTRPVTLVGVRQAQWLGLKLPRENLVSHLGFEPQGGTRGRAHGQAARILSQLALDPVGNAEPAGASADGYMRLVVYDLLGALFAPPVQSRTPTPGY